MRLTKSWQVVWCALMLGACGSQSVDTRLTVCTTIPPIADITAQIAGPHAEVFCLLEAGQDPHGFEPTPSQVLRMSRSRLLIRVGLGLDDWASRSASAVMPKDARGLALAPLVIPEAIEEHSGEEHAEGEHSHDHGSADPHFWMDPQLAIEAVPHIERELSRVDPERADTYAETAKKLVTALEELDRELALELAPYRGMAFLGQHGAYTWFAKRYGFNQVGLIESWPGKSVTPRMLAALLDEARKNNVGAVLCEIQRNRGIAETVAEELGVPLTSLDPLGGNTWDPPRGYTTMMRWNVGRILETIPTPGRTP